jgi:5-methylcytosine-specific restriction endonuclease McrA
VTKNRDKKLAATRKWQREHAEHRRRYRNEWTLKNHDKVLAQKARFRKNNPDKVRAWVDEWMHRTEPGNTHPNGFLARQRAYYKNPEKYKQKSKEWRDKNPDKANARCRDYYHKHKERIREYQRLWKPRSPKRLEMIERWGVCDETCYICGEHLDDTEITIDHVFPSVYGGRSTIDNLMPVHGSCNSRKQHKLDFPLARPDLLIRVGIVVFKGRR